MLSLERLSQIAFEEMSNLVKHQLAALAEKDATIAALLLRVNNARAVLAKLSNTTNTTEDDEMSEQLMRLPDGDFILPSLIESVQACEGDIYSTIMPRVVVKAGERYFVCNYQTFEGAKAARDQIAADIAERTKGA